MTAFFREKTKRAVYLCSATLLLCVLASAFAVQKNDNMPLVDSNERSFSDFRIGIIENVMSGDINCDYDHKVEHVACLAFQSAMGSLRVKNFQIDRLESFVEFEDELNVLYAIEAMNAVATHMPSGRYSLAKRILGSKFTKPGTDAELCLNLGYGICGNHAATFLELMSLMGVEARAVQIFYSNEHGFASHIAAEILSRGKWRFFDTTYGTFYLEDPQSKEILSFAEARQNQNYRVQYESNLWAYVSRDIVDVHEYLRLPADIVYGYDNGVITIGENRLRDQIVDLAHIPNHIGDSVADGPFEGVRYKFSLSDQAKISVGIAGLGGCSSPNNQICVDENCKRLTQSSLIFENVGNQSELRIISNEPLCYAVIDEIAFEKPHYR